MLLMFKYLFFMHEKHMLWFDDYMQKMRHIKILSHSGVVVQF